MFSVSAWPTPCLHVVDVAARAAHQIGVLLTRYGLPDAEFAHRSGQLLNFFASASAPRLNRETSEPTATNV
jgi:hypothetical protein